MNGSVQIGLAEVKEVGAAGYHIVAEREANGEFKNLHELLTRVTVPGKNGAAATKLPVGAVQGLIEAGTLDRFGPRLGLVMTLRPAHKGVLPPVDAEWSDVGAVFPEKNVEPGSIYRVYARTGWANAFIESPSLSGMQLLEIAQSIDEADSRWKKKYDGEFTWFLLDQAGVVTASAEEDQAA